MYTDDISEVKAAIAYVLHDFIIYFGKQNDPNSLSAEFYLNEMNRSGNPYIDAVLLKCKTLKSKRTKSKSEIFINTKQNTLTSPHFNGTKQLNGQMNLISGPITPKKPATIIAGTKKIPLRRYSLRNRVPHNL